MISKKRFVNYSALNLFICLFLTSKLIGEGFIKGTPVATPKGHTPIEELKVDDEVLSLNFHKGTICTDKIIKIEKHKTRNIIQIFVGDEVIEVDADHKFFSPLLKSCWVKAKNLEKRNLLLKNISQLIPIQRITKLEKDAEVYNLSIKDNHNYFVTKQNILTHNFLAETCAAISAFSAAVEAKIGIDLVGITIGMVVNAVINSITNKEARQQAGEWGWEEDKNPPKKVKEATGAHGNPPVFRDPVKNRWISPDQNGHGGGVWKEFDRKGRTGTLDGNLKPIRR